MEEYVTHTSLGLLVAAAGKERRIFNVERSKQDAGEEQHARAEIEASPSAAKQEMRLHVHIDHELILLRGTTRQLLYGTYICAST
jgi:hypothetical protein